MSESKYYSRTSVTVDETIELLNEALRLDPIAIHSLVEARQPCNKELADHPTVIVADCEGEAQVGLLGIINGLFGVVEIGQGGHVTAYYDDNGQLVRFGRSEPNATT